MNAEKIEKVSDLASEIVAKCILVLEEMKGHGYVVVGTKKTGELKRLSMDLTRALTEMRKPG